MEAPQAVQLRRLCTAPAERLCPRATWWAVDREISSCISVRESPTLHREINNILKIKVVCCFLFIFLSRKQPECVKTNNEASHTTIQCTVKENTNILQSTIAEKIQCEYHAEA